MRRSWSTGTITGSGGFTAIRGVHYMDMPRWALGKEAPRAVTAMGGEEHGDAGAGADSGGPSDGEEVPAVDETGDGGAECEGEHRYGVPHAELSRLREEQEEVQPRCAGEAPADGGDADCEHRV